MDSAKSVCNGDSGGPLLTSDGLQVGITSFGTVCSSFPLPNGFTRVSHYYFWIQEQICQWSNFAPLTCATKPPPDDGLVHVNITMQVSTLKHDEEQSFVPG
jgi:secreted trypsin-like serine protease